MLKQLIRNFDWVLFGATVALVVMGLINIGSATHINKEGIKLYGYVSKQSMFFLFNALILFALQAFDYQDLRKSSRAVYIIMLAVLGAVIVVGKSALGAQRWIELGPITIQPSEFCKILMIISLAYLLESRINKLNTLKELLPVILFIGAPFGLVFAQPDLGTALVFMAITVSMTFIANINLKLVRNIALSTFALLPFGWFFLKDYQKNRILVFLNPNIDPLGAGYHIIQSKIAIGSGKLFGKGLFQGTQSQLNFLPENHTDFVFSVIGEELGFVGCVIVVLLYFIVLYRGIEIARTANDEYGSLLAIGITSMIAFQVLVNIGMTTGMMPVTGIPLPFVSYGVSSLTTNMIGIALLENIYMRHKKLMF